jgi:methylmalonyl-CoA mutase cobalamin-binding subunit
VTTNFLTNIGHLVVTLVICILAAILLITGHITSDQFIAIIAAFGGTYVGVTGLTSATGAAVTSALNAQATVTPVAVTTTTTPVSSTTVTAPVPVVGSSPATV